MDKLSGYSWERGGARITRNANSATLNRPCGQFQFRRGWTMCLPVAPGTSIIRAALHSPSVSPIPMPVPLLDVNAQNHPLEAEFTAAFQRVFKSGQFIMGPDVEALEKELCQLTGAKHALGVSS